MAMKPSSVEDVMGILQDVNSQVELERQKRITLEAQVEKARRRKQQQQEEKESTASRSTRRRRSSRAKESIALQTQVDGYRQLVEILTKERPAIAAAVLREKQRGVVLPLKLVRLLEWIPWHPYVQERVDVQDAIYEWQHFDQGWKGDLPTFPDFFHALPVTTSPHGDDDIDTEQGSSDDEEGDSSSDEASVTERRTSLTSGNTSTALDFSSFLAGLLPSRTKGKPSRDEQLVLTNANLTQRFVLNAKDGYPLPNPSVSGTWRWIGRWNVERPTLQMEPTPAKLHKSILTFFDHRDDDKEEAASEKDDLCDREGWTYAREASHFVVWNATELCWGKDVPCSCYDSGSETDEPASDTRTCVQCRHRRKPVLRRRKWTRQRVLVDYPLASECSQEYLRLGAHNASMNLATQELAERYVETSSTNQCVQDHWETTEKAHKVQLKHYESTWERHEEQIKNLRYGKFKRKIEELACNQDDILPIIANPNLFKQLQQALRRSGAVTNSMLQQGIHFYILDHVRPVHGKSRRRKSSCGGGGSDSGNTRRHSTSSQPTST